MKISAIAKIYARKCEERGLNFNNIPAKKQAEVKAQLEIDGYVISEDGVVSKAEPEEEEIEE